MCDANNVIDPRGLATMWTCEVDNNFATSSASGGSDTTVLCPCFHSRLVCMALALLGLVIGVILGRRWRRHVDLLSVEWQVELAGVGDAAQLAIRALKRHVV